MFGKNKLLALPLSTPTRWWLWVSTLFGLLCLMSVVNIVLATGLLLVFVVVSVVVPPTFWSPLKRLLLFIPLLAGVFIQMGTLNKEVGTALLAVTMIVKFVEIRSRKDIGMMLVCNTLAPFVAFLQKENAVLLALGAATFVATLVSAQSAFSVPAKTSAFTQSLKSLGSVFVWAIVLLPLTAALYLFAPRVDSPLWGGFHNQAKTGVGEEMNVSQWTELFNDLSTAFRVRFSGPPPKPQEMYFRGATLWTFNGTVWSAPPLHAGTVVPVSEMGDKNNVRFNYSVTYVTPTSRLYALDFPVSAPEDTVLLSDGVLRPKDGRPDTFATSLQAAEPLSSELSLAQRRSALQLPAGLNPRTVQQARLWRKRFPHDRDYVNFVMKHFADNYQYSLSPTPLAQPHVVDSFVFDTRTGFCAHYSSAFAVLMRAANIPTRVVNGYWGNEMDETGGYYRIRQADAHAWNEVWLEGRWVRFDPTSQVTNIRHRSDTSWNLLNQGYSLSDWMSSRWSDQLLSYDEATQEQFVQAVKNKLLSIPSYVLFIVIACMVVGLWPLLRGWRPHRKTPQDRLAEMVNQWFAQFPHLPPHLGWERKAEMVSHNWPLPAQQALKKAIEEAQEALYANKPVSLNKIRTQLKKLSGAPGV